MAGLYGPGYIPISYHVQLMSKCAVYSPAFMVDKRTTGCREHAIDVCTVFVYDTYIHVYILSHLWGLLAPLFSNLYVLCTSM